MKKADWSLKPTIMMKLVESVDCLEGRLEGDYERFLQLKIAN